MNGIDVFSTMNEFRSKRMKTNVERIEIDGDRFVFVLKDDDVKLSKFRQIVKDIKNWFS